MQKRKLKKWEKFGILNYKNFDHFSAPFQLFCQLNCRVYQQRFLRRLVGKERQLDENEWMSDFPLKVQLNVHHGSRSSDHLAKAGSTDRWLLGTYTNTLEKVRQSRRQALLYLS